MVRCRDIIAFMEQVAPCELAEEWDNVGLLLGNREAAVKKIMLCLDITTSSVKEALIHNADMIITHHPVIFKSLNRVVEGEPKGNLLYPLIKNGISVYAAHTNLDFAVSGINTHLANVLGLKALEAFGKGPGKTGLLECELGLKEFAGQVKAALDVPFVRIVGKEDKAIRKVAVFSGSFDDDLEAVTQAKADVLVTGDLKYHTAIDAMEAGICIIDAGHFNTEKIVLPALATAFKDNFADIEVHYFQKEEDPFKTY